MRQSSSGIASFPDTGCQGTIPLPTAGAASPPLCERGVALLASLIREAERDKLFGTVSVKLTFKRGRVLVIRHEVAGTEK